MENINFGWFSSGKLVAPKEDNIQLWGGFLMGKEQKSEVYTMILNML